MSTVRIEEQQVTQYRAVCEVCGTPGPLRLLREEAEKHVCPCVSDADRLATGFNVETLRMALAAGVKKLEVATGQPARATSEEASTE